MLQTRALPGLLLTNRSSPRFRFVIGNIFSKIERPVSISQRSRQPFGFTNSGGEFARCSPMRMIRSKMGSSFILVGPFDLVESDKGVRAAKDRLALMAWTTTPINHKIHGGGRRENPRQIQV